MNEIIQTIAVYALPVIFAITLHEAAHAFAAKYFGDTTAYSQGRMSLNPMTHIDPYGTIVIPVVLYIATGGAFVFGYAKPVPIDFSKLRNPKRDMAWVSLAGPGANFVMALMWLVFWIILGAAKITEPFLMQMAGAGVSVNLLLFALNLIPIPPLDGGRIMASLLPHKYSYKYAQIEPYGFFIVMILMIIKIGSQPILQFWMAPVTSVAAAVLTLLASPLKILLN
jgi:Zn-dependent protease